MKSLAILRNLGPAWTIERSAYLLRKKSGLLKRRFPTPQWNEIELASLLKPGVPAEPIAYAEYRKSHTPPFFFSSGSMADVGTLKRVMTERGASETIRIADDFCTGKFLLYSHHRHDLGQPINWLLNPFTGASHDPSLHWCDSPTFSERLGDIKDVWEASRFACAFWLARAYALASDEAYPLAFWQLVESWLDQDPPNRGPNWKCGQETALRCMAWSFALYAFANSPATTPARLTAIVKAFALQADRIAGNISYAVSQKNNHGISEASGLITIGLLFPELRGSKKWLTLGKRIFEQEVLRQIYDDGSYVQQSMNYHRVMLHDCLWVVRMCELNNNPIADEVRRRIATAGRFLQQMLDEPSGCVPNYGANDGALVLPLSSCDYTDYRPTAAAAMYFADGRRVLSDGPWNELALWLYGPESLRSPVNVIEPTSQRFDAGGYYTIRNGRDWCMIRCHSYRDRPAHVDPLHLDLWHNGVNILSDSGTFKYYNPAVPAVEAFFKDIRAHNTIEIDNRGPLELISRFMWDPWPKAHCIHHSCDSFEGEHHAYARSPWNIVHRRRVQRDPSGWTVIDNLDGGGAHDVILHWHTIDCPCEITDRGVTIRTSAGVIELGIVGPRELSLFLRRGEEHDTPTGWISVYYGEKSPRPTIEVRGRIQLPAEINTRVRFLPDGASK
jgi:hypothetical protein